MLMQANMQRAAASARLLCTLTQVRNMSSNPQSRNGSASAVLPNSMEGSDHVHFRLTPNAHPLGKDKRTWENPTQNHIWAEEDLEKLLAKEQSNPTHYKPKGAMDRLIYWAVRGCYHAFNFVTGFSQTDPTPRSLIYRVLILESIAGCPGMVAAGMRHFKSLRRMERDGGWIHTLLEEAENERMHLLVFMRMFSPGLATRVAVVAMQYVIVAFLSAMYIIRPQVVHRFVGYLEETAVQTYVHIIRHLETPGTKIHEAWSELPAPTIAKNYWRLPEDALFLDVVKQICADEMHHRDVNHEFASLKQNDFNPFVADHIQDADLAAQARRRAEAVTAKVKEMVEEEARANASAKSA